MATQMQSPPDLNFVDPRKSYTNDPNSHLVGAVLFTANATGTTTTIKGADATLATGVNAIRVGDKFKLFTAAGIAKEETIFIVSSVASATGTTTATFTPAASVAPVSTDVARIVSVVDYNSNESLDRVLKAISSSKYSDARLAVMTQNDKVFALRLENDPKSF